MSLYSSIRMCVLLMCVLLLVCDSPLLFCPRTVTESAQALVKRKSSFFNNPLSTHNMYDSNSICALGTHCKNINYYTFGGLGGVSKSSTNAPAVHLIFAFNIIKYMLCNPIQSSTRVFLTIKKI